MPFKSKAQQRFMFAAEARGLLPKGMARRWAHETKSIKNLPEKVDDKRDDTVSEKTAAMVEYLMEKRAETLKGGLADGKKDKEFPKDQIEKGKKVEKEHTDSKAKAKEIAKDHLVEDKKYYTKLEKMEKSARAKPQKKDDLDTPPLNTFEKHPKKILAGGAAAIGAALAARKVHKLGGSKEVIKKWKQWRGDKAAKKYAPDWIRHGEGTLKTPAKPVRKSQFGDAIGKSTGAKVSTKPSTKKPIIRHRGADLKNFREGTTHGNRGHKLPAPKEYKADPPAVGPKKEVVINPPRQTKKQVESAGGIVLPAKTTSATPPSNPKKLKRQLRREGKKHEKRTLRDLKPEDREYESYKDLYETDIK